MRSLLPLIGAALLVIIGFTLQGALGYAFFLEELYPPPPSADTPTDDDPLPTTQPRAQRLVIVLLDSVREDIFADPDIMPYVQRIASSNTAARGISITQPVSMTLLSVLNLGTGRTPGIGWSVQNFSATTFPDESLFYWAHRAELPIAFLGDASWSQLYGDHATYTHTFPDAGNFDRFERGLSVKDNEAIQHAPDILSRPDDFPIVVIHLVSTDKVSHRHGATMRDDDGNLTPYADAAHLLDAAVGTLFDDHHQPGDLWFITSDHGATDWGTHGGGETIARRAPFLLVSEALTPPAQPLEVPLNTWAPTLSLALGLPIPRTAELPATLDLFDFSDTERANALAQHAQRRRAFTHDVIVAELGDASDPSLFPTPDTPPEDAIPLYNQSISELRSNRRWRYTLGLILGALFQIVGFALLLRARNDDDPAHPPHRLLTPAFLAFWVFTLPALIFFDDWIYHFVTVFGEAARGPYDALVAAATLAALTALIIGVTRLLTRSSADRSRELQRAALTTLFGIGVLVTSHAIVKFPYGPIAQAYHLTLLWTLLATGYVAFKARSQRATWALAAASCAGFIIAYALSDGTHTQLLAETTTSAITGIIAIIATTTAATFALLRRENTRRARIIIGAIAATLLTSTLTYRAFSDPLVARFILPALALVLFTLLTTRALSNTSRRDLLFAFALALAHVMSTDHVALITLPLAGFALAISLLPLPKRTSSALLLAFLVGFLDIALFYTLGYMFSFSSVDANVVFMLDHSSINLQAGFLLLLLQHSPRWILLWTAVLYNRTQAEDTRGLQLVFVAMLLTFTLRTFAPFFAISFKLQNHWFIMHAVPLFVMTIGSCLIATLWFSLIGLGFRRHNTPQRS